MKFGISLILALVTIPTMVKTIYGDSTAGMEYRVLEVEGDAGVMPDGGKAVSPVLKDLTLEAGDRLITGPNGWIEFATKDGTVMELKENSALKVESLSAQVSRFFLRVGRLIGKFSSGVESKHAYNINTPVAVAAVRGTELALSVEESGETNAGVVEGEVAFGPTEMEQVPAELEAPHARIKIESSSPVPEKEGETVIDPDWSGGEITVQQSEGISIKPKERPAKLPEIPPVITKDLASFPRLRERIPHLRDQWKHMDPPSQRQFRQMALRDRIKWQIPPRMKEQIDSPRTMWQKRSGPPKLAPSTKRPPPQKPPRPNRPPPQRRPVKSQP